MTDFLVSSPLILNVVIFLCMTISLVLSAYSVYCALTGKNKQNRVLKKQGVVLLASMAVIAVAYGFILGLLLFQQILMA